MGITCKGMIYHGDKGSSWSRDFHSQEAEMTTGHHQLMPKASQENIQFSFSLSQDPTNRMAPLIFRVRLPSGTPRGVFASRFQTEVKTGCHNAHLMKPWSWANMY